MKLKITIFFIYVLLFQSCDINQPTENKYDKSLSENGLTLFLKNGSLDSPGEIEIINNTNRKIFIPYILYPYCSFSIYSLSQSVNSVWENLTYQDNHWIKLTNQDSILVICEIYMKPIEINPYKSYKEKISGIEKTGKYLLKIYYRYTEVYDQKSENNSLIIGYSVN